VSVSGARARPLRRGAVLRTVLLCLVLTLGFALALFPVERLQGPVRGALASATGAEVALGEIRMGLGPTGPALRSRAVVLRWPASGELLEIADARVRPAWSLSWLRGRSAWHLDFSGEAGRIAGTLWPEGPAFSGRTDDLDLSALPRALVGDVPPLAGRLDATVSLYTSEAGVLHGELSLTAQDGTLFLPDTPVAIPYADLRASLSRASDGATTLRALRLEGPMLTLDGQGTLGAGLDAARAPLALDLTIHRIDPLLAPLLQTVGIRAQPGLESVLRITGTLERPVVVAR
jgi:type II secretion system protein N